MTKQELARELQEFVKEAGKRPPEEQVRGLIEAGVIDEKGHVLVGNGKQAAKGKKTTRTRRTGKGASPGNK